MLPAESHASQFLPDHPGGEKAIILYAGRDATEEFNMLHDAKVSEISCLLGSPV
jgi:cytochrome b involved in lipid metabolism